jgi:hypothetical protein
MFIPLKNDKKVDEKYVFKRTIPKGLAIEIEKGDKVKEDSVLASGETTSVRSRIDVAAALNVDVKDAKKYLKCLNGERVLQGDIIASKRKTLVRKGVDLTASVSGVVDLSEVHLGFIKILDVAQLCSVNSGVEGKVVSIIKSKQIGIVSEVLIVKPFWIFGESWQSELYHIDIKDSRVEMGENLKDSTVFLENYDLKDEKLLRRLATIGVQGIILASVTMSLRQKVDEQGLWGMNLCVIEGFGSLEINERLAQLLKMNDGRLCLLDSEKQELILTKYDKRTFTPEKKQRFLVKVKVGLDVQVFEEENWGAYGEIESIEDGFVSVKLQNKSSVHVDILNIIAV